MKKYLLVLFIAVPFIASAQFEMKHSYVFNSPQNYMRSSLDNAHGFGFDYFASVKKTPYYIGLGFQWGAYGFQTEPIDFVATDGSIVKTNLNITNSFHSWSIYHKLRFNKFENNGSRVVPFIEAKTGWSFFRTNLYIEDPEDETNCEPLEQDVIQKDNTWNIYGGAGFDFRINGLFRPERNECPMKTYFNISAGFHYGGRVSYMNVDRDESNAAMQHNHGTQTTDEGQKTEYYTTWVNTQTQVQHQHHTGYVYTSPLRMMEIKAGFTIRF